MNLLVEQRTARTVAQQAAQFIDARWLGILRALEQVRDAEQFCANRSDPIMQDGLRAPGQRVTRRRRVGGSAQPADQPETRAGA